MNAFKKFINKFFVWIRSIKNNSRLKHNTKQVKNGLKLIYMHLYILKLNYNV